MRYYKITFSSSGTTELTNVVPFEFTSHLPSPFASGQLIFNPGALDVEFDITVGYVHNLQVSTHLRIYNPTLEMLQNASAYQGLNVTIEAGFKHGMPLANNLETKSGQIAFGAVQNCFGNWMGTELALDFIIIASPLLGNPDSALPVSNSVNSPRNYLFQWYPKQTLADAIKGALACYGIDVVGSIKNIVNPNQNTFTHSVSGFQAFADFINEQSSNWVNPSTKEKTSVQTEFYSGVFLSFGKNAKQIIMSDNSFYPPAIPLQYEDFVGQPTFNTKQIAYNDKRNILVPAQVVSVHPMRADIGLITSVKYPAKLSNQLNGSSAFASGKQLVRGLDTMAVTEVRHTGRFRDIGPQGWVTNLRCNWTGQQST